MSRVVVSLFAIVACSPSQDLRSEERGSAVPEAGPPVSVDQVEIVKGVPDRGRDPGVVAIDVGGDGLCTGALVSPRLVLTARHCVTRTVEHVACPPPGPQVFEDRAPASLSILAGEDVASARRVARGVAIVAPAGLTLCDADIALVVLDEAVTTVKPLPVATRGAAQGDHVRAVGFGRTDTHRDGGVKLVREHVRVRTVTPAEFTVGEATCQGDSGGPALDEETGEIVGIVSRGGPSCEGPNAHNVYTRIDTYRWLVEEAFARVAEIVRDEKIDAGADDPSLSAPKRGSKSKPPSDVGGPCERGGDCAAGICVIDGARRYCSRACGQGDRCPTRYHCMEVAKDVGTLQACINVR
jgi:hypothetical protein